MLCLSVSMSANCGGTGSLIGTGPNLIALELIEQQYGFGTPLSFATWLAFGFPQLILCLMVIWIWLNLYFQPKPYLITDAEIEVTDAEKEEHVRFMLKTKQLELGPLSYGEKSVTILFLVLGFLWFTRSPGFITGWGDLLNNYNGARVSDSTTGIFVALLCFALPSMSFWNPNLDEDEGSLISWKIVEEKIPWGIVLLFGGGFALGEGSHRSGLSHCIGQKLMTLSTLPAWEVVIISTCITSAITQIASNAATSNMILPILLELSELMCINPILMILPATCACSFTFILPVSTGPNAIVFGPSGLSTLQMVKAGWVINLATLIITFACTFTYGTLLFDLHTYPSWAVTVVGNCSVEGSSL